jgi:hypothetical protein
LREEVRNVGRKKRTPDELRRVSEHLHYEVQMLLGSAQGLDSETKAEGTLHNALVESFAIHLRNMLDSLWPDKPKRKSDWVIAADFFQLLPNGPFTILSFSVLWKMAVMKSPKLQNVRKLLV